MGKLFGNRVLHVSMLLGVALLLLAGCDPAEPVANVDSQARKIVTFDGGAVTQGELDRFAEQSGFGSLSKDDPQYRAAVQQIMPQLVSIEIAKAYAQEHNITVSDKEVDHEIEKIKKQVGEQARSSGQDLSNQKAYEQALKQNNITEEQLRDDIRENLPVQKVQKRVAGNAEPSDKEIQNYYEQNKEAQFTTPEQRCVRHILFNKDQKQKAEEVKQQLKNGGDFAKLAKEYSQDPGSAAKGGDLGCIGKGDTVPDFEKAAFGAEQGEIVGPVKTQFGYHILQVTDVKPKHTRSLQEVESQIRSQLSTQKQSEKFSAWVKKQEKKRDVKYLKGYKPADQG
ncbi:MAG: peptidylprolyl isomerase [Actinomycetota bacterium]|nr:peptidylprolyl isomerase [Actinomycetota bacterium]